MVIFIVLWPYLLITKLSCLQKNNIGHTSIRTTYIVASRYVLCNFKFQLCTKALRPNANRDAYRSTCNGGNLNKIARLKYS